MVAVLIRILFMLTVLLVACGAEGRKPSSSRPWDQPIVFTMEQMTLYSDIVARVRLLDKSSFVVRDSVGNGIAVLEFRFQVIEYLKGTGANEIYGWAVDFPSESASGMEEWHDANHPYDGREAVVFFDNRSYYLPPIEMPENKYIMSSFFYIRDGVKDGYTIASPHSKNWFPAAAVQTGTRSADPLFMIDVPRTTPSKGKGARTPNEDAQTMSLSAIKQLIAGVEAEANVGGTEEYRNCVLGQHNHKGILAYEQEQRGERHETWTTQQLGSGQPAGQVLHTWFYPVTTLTATTTNGLEGEDAAHFALEVGPTVTTSINVVNESQRRIETKRPLPEGDYEFFVNQHRPSVCAPTIPDFARNRVKAFVTVNALQRVLHEFFFDPTTIGTAVGADGSNGVLEPNAFSLNNTTTTISSLKWQDGAVTMTLSPTASLADYAIDFIDVTGTTTLSLTSDNASTTALTWTVPDKPWADGDLLMLRIHKPVSNDATLSSLTLSGIDITFSPTTTTYTASVPATTTQTTVTPTAKHDAATYVVKLAGATDADGTIPLAAGTNVITIDVTAEDAVTTQTYSVTITRATPSSPVTVTLIPRIDSLTFFDIDIQWSYSGSCDNYYVAIITDADYQISFLGFHPPETSSHYVEGSWLYNNVPDFWVVVECRTSGDSQEVGRASLRAAHPDNN